MSFIEVKHINKTFKVPLKEKGKFGTLKSFFNRKYKYIKAINDISFSIKKGEIVGYIGPNGAGKSTTIKILSGILVPDSGNVVIDKMTPWIDRKKYVSKIGVVFGQRSQLWWDIPAIDSFNLLKDIYKLDDKEYQKTLNELIELLNLKDIINIPVRQLSLGNRMKCEIAASLIHKPKILFLDEPTIGLDAVSKKIVREFIKKINKKNKVTIILTTHDMADIEVLAKRIILIGKGKLLYDGSLTKLKHKYDYLRKIKVITKDKLKINEDYIVEQKNIDGGIEFIIDIRKIEINEFIKLISSKLSIIDIDIDSGNIDELIVKLYEDFKI
ncbi:MAG: ATP-binding cassette domain-containing protein [Bacilli bacterium]|nr:ATP-binding cassette domain-containing protein [Bacilli bacterium]